MMSDVRGPVVVAVPGDLHLTEPNRENARVAFWAVGEINRLIRPDFVQFIGDNVQDATESQFRRFDEIRGSLEVPHFALVGDHDVKDDPSAAGFRAHVGDPWGATSLRGFRFIRLNTQESRPLGLSSDQTAWFRAEVDDALAKGERVVIFQHNYPYQIWEDFAGSGIDEWRAVVQTRRVEAIICGHTHYGQVANDGRNVMIASRSIGDPEGGLPGFGVFYFHGDDLAMTYRSVDDGGPLVLVTHPRERLLATGPRHIVQVHDRVVARVWSAQGIATVRCRIDGATWVPLTDLGDGHWTGPLSCSGLAKGTHTLDAIAATHDGAEGRQTIEFIVDPTGRYTAVPEVHPKVTSTAFC